MTGIKVMLAFGIGAAYASTWWAAAMFGWFFVDGSSVVVPLWLIPILSTVVLAMVCGKFLNENWHDEGDH